MFYFFGSPSVVKSYRSRDHNNNNGVLGVDLDLSISKIAVKFLPNSANNCQRQQLKSSLGAFINRINSVY